MVARRRQPGFLILVTVGTATLSFTRLMAVGGSVEEERFRDRWLASVRDARASLLADRWQTAVVLEYREPPPPPPPAWWSLRGEQLWTWRGEVVGRTVWLGGERLLPRGGPGAWRCVWARTRLRCRSWSPPSLTCASRRCGGGSKSMSARRRCRTAFLRLGVRFSDGRVATNLPGGYWTAPEEGPVFLTPHQANTPEELDCVPGAIALQWEVWPTPPAGELTVACAWPAFGVPEQHVVFDGTTMAAATKRLRRAAPRSRPRTARPSGLRRPRDHGGSAGRHGLAHTGLPHWPARARTGTRTWQRSPKSPTLTIGPLTSPASSCASTRARGRPGPTTTNSAVRPRSRRISTVVSRVRTRPGRSHTARVTAPEHS